MARVSTRDQEEDGWSLDAQIERFHTYARVHGLELVEVLADAKTGQDLDREGLQRAIAILEAGGAEGLLVAKLDRLTRNVADWERLQAQYFRHRFALLSVGDPIDLTKANGRMFARIIVVFAQYEVEVNGERTSEGVRQARAAGGGTPRVEGEALARIVALSAEGLSFRAIAARLVEEGIPTRKGGRWAAETVRKVLVRARENG